MFNNNHHRGTSERVSEELIRKYATDGLQDKPSEAPIPTKDPKPWLQSLGETYYVVESDNRYVDGVRTIYVDDNLYEVQISTTKSLLECDRYSTREEAQEIADKYFCNVRKVIVKVEE